MTAAFVIMIQREAYIECLKKLTSLTRVLNITLNFIQYFNGRISLQFFIVVSIPSCLSIALRFGNTCLFNLRYCYIRKMSLPIAHLLAP